MPHGLTPLGRQLRSVLAAISSPCRPDLRHLAANGRSRRAGPHHAVLRSQHDIGNSSRHCGSALVRRRPAADDNGAHDEAAAGDPTTSRHLGPDRVKRLVATTLYEPPNQLWANAALREPCPAQSGLSPSHIKHDIGNISTQENRRNRDDEASQPTDASRGFQVVDSIKSVDNSGGTRQQIDRKNQGANETWAEGLPDSSSPAALDALLRQLSTGNGPPLTLHALNTILLNAPPRARMLNHLLHLAWTTLSHIETTAPSQLTPSTVFDTCMRLVRHAREVWPQCLNSVAELLLHFMVACDRQVPAPALITQLLNAAMWQIAQPLAVSPFKDVSHQETAIICILSFMAEHKPALQIDRQGYRAVIRMQLSQPKTESERKWAALKALSWPPWKEDRTAMDSELGPEQGISRAGATLRRMQEAGYAFQGWERVAMIYSGWDTDNTPTIQRRSRHMPSQIDTWNEAQYIWAARIECTRTAQEAWACFEAAEAARVHPTKSMLLAIVQKLHGEEQRLALARESEHVNPFARDTFAGDSPAVLAPPPSTHQHTFTRTPPPKMHEFYERCMKHGLHFKGLALAYLVANAKSHQVGLRYLRSAGDAYAGIMQMLRASSDADAFEVPAFLLGAYVALLTKPHTNIRIHTSVNSGWLLPPSDKLHVMTLHPRSSLVRAVSLLLRSRTVNMQAYAVLLRAFGRISLTERSYILRHDVVESSAPFGAEMKVLTAYRLAQCVVDLLTSKGRDPDVPSFLHLCYATENAALACWRVLTAKQCSLPDDAKHSAAPAPLVTAEIEDVLGSLLPVQYLVSHFETLTDTEQSSSHVPVPPDPAIDSTSPSKVDIPYLPRLLNVPGPAVLHAYIRALGWHGAHRQIHATLQFIKGHADELAEQRAKDRGGEEHWRLCIIAARVFLEREWLRDAWSEESSVAESTLLGGFVQSAAAKMVAECRSLANESLGGWPTDEEVEAYVRKGWDRFGAVLHQNSYDEVDVDAGCEV